MNTTFTVLFKIYDPQMCEIIEFWLLAAIPLNAKELVRIKIISAGQRLDKFMVVSSSCLQSGKKHLMFFSEESVVSSHDLMYKLNELE